MAGRFGDRDAAEAPGLEGEEVARLGRARRAGGGARTACGSGCRRRSRTRSRRGGRSASRGSASSSVTWSWAPSASAGISERSTVPPATAGAMRPLELAGDELAASGSGGSRARARRARSSIRAPAKSRAGKAGMLAVADLDRRRRRGSRSASGAAAPSPSASIRRHSRSGSWTQSASASTWDGPESSTSQGRRAASPWSIVWRPSSSPGSAGVGAHLEPAAGPEGEHRLDRGLAGRPDLAAPPRAR